MQIRIKPWEKYCEYLKQIKWKVKPLYWFSAAIILAVIVIAATIMLITLLQLKVSFILPIVLGLSVADLMIGYPYLLATKRIDSIEKTLPDALKQMADILKTGGTYEFALRELTQTISAPLKTEFENVLRKLEEGENIRIAMQSLPENIDSIAVKRATTIIVDSLEAGAPLSEILEDIAEDLRDNYRIKSERKSLTLMQALFMVVAGVIVAPFIFGMVAVIIEFLVNTVVSSLTLTEAQKLSALAIRDTMSILFQIYIFFMVLAVSSMVAVMREGKLSGMIILAPILLLLAFIIYFLAGVMIGGLLATATIS